MTRRRHRAPVSPPTEVDRRWLRVTTVGLALILLLLLAVILLARRSASQDRRIDGQNRQVQHLNDLAGAYADAAQAGKEVARQIKVACANRALSGSICQSASSVAAAPAPTVSPTGAPTGPPPSVTVTPTQADMVRAVAAYCSPGVCSSPPTPGQVQAAFDVWCAAHAGCRGPAGKPGASGAAGAAGPSGQPGAAGVNGADGAAGVSVTGASQDADHHLILTFSDGATVDAGELPPGPAGPAGQDGRDATPQTFSFTYTVPGNGLGDDRAYTTTCAWDPTDGYQCETKGT